MIEIKCFLCNTTELSPATISSCTNNNKGCEYKIISCYKCSKHTNYKMNDHLNYSCEYNSKTKKKLESEVLTKEKRIEKLEKELEKLRLENSQLTAQIETSSYQNKQKRL